MIAIPYGKSHLDVAFPYNGLLTSRVDELKSDRTGRELVEEAMASPIGTPVLPRWRQGRSAVPSSFPTTLAPCPAGTSCPPCWRSSGRGIRRFG